MTTREARSSGTATPARGRAGSPGAFRSVDLIEVPRNPGIPLDLGWVRDIRINRSAVERRAATIPTRRSIKTAWQAGWLLRAISLMDLTTLAGDDTHGRVLRLCAKARRPVARLVPFAPPGRRPLGLDAGKVWIADDFDAPLPDDILADFER